MGLANEAKWGGNTFINRTHFEHVMVYMLSGEMDINDNGIDYKLLPGDVIFLCAGTHHFGTKPCPADSAIMFVHFNAAPGDRYTEFHDKNEEFDELSISTVVHCKKYPQVESVFRRAVRAFFDSPYRDDHSESSRQLKKLLSLIRNIDAGVISKSIAITENCISLIKTNPKQYFTMKDFSNRLFVSESTIRKAFAKEYGKTVYDIQKDIKLELAKTIISSKPDIKFSVLAENVGYCDEFQLSKLFKAKYGINMSQFRRQCVGELETDSRKSDEVQ